MASEHFILTKYYVVKPVMYSKSAIHIDLT